MHIPYLVEYDDKFELVALVDVAKLVLEAVADRFHITERYTDWRELLARDDIDTVVICHSGSHRDSVIAALDAGKHVFCEKPLAWNLREVEEVAARAAKSDRVVQLGYHKLYDPGFFYAKAQLEKMRDVGFGRITVLHPWNDLGFSPHRLRHGDGRFTEGHVDPKAWEDHVNGVREGLSGGVVASLVDEALGDRKDQPDLRIAYGMATSSIIHQVYMMFGFLGEPTRVMNAHVWREGMSIHALIEYPNDLRVSMDWHFLSHLKDYREEYAFFGNHDRVILQFPSPYFRNFPSPVIVQGGEGELSWEKHITVSHDEPFRIEMLAFYDNVMNGKKPATTVEDALKHHRFIQQLINAVR